MTKTAILIGGAGTGKTTELLRLMGLAIETGQYDVRDVGFFSFTRSARQEAADRASLAFDCNPRDLTDKGYFKTAHALAYGVLGVGGELLAPGRETQEWIQDQLQEPVSGASDAPLEDAQDRAATDADMLLHAWQLARNRMVSLRSIHDEMVSGAGWGPRWSLDEAERIVERYEQAKRLDHRCDFTDMLARFAGWSFQPAGGLKVEPAGECPRIPVMFIDEAQDNTALMDACFRRLAEHARWVYLSGDPYQSIYGWAGSDHSLFVRWPDAKTRVMPRSYRCPSAVLDRGEQCLAGCSDYWDRGIQPARDGGSVHEFADRGDWLQAIDPAKSWLLLARTNFQAGRIKSWLKDECVPWVPIKGKGGWAPSRKTMAKRTLQYLEYGRAVTWDEWGDVVHEIPAKYLERGTKTGWAARELPPETQRMALPADLIAWGATPELLETISSGRWPLLVDGGHEYRAAVKRYGFDHVDAPQIKVGTIHASKGMEADNVVVLTTTSRPVWAASDSDPRQADEERRLGYVAVTRARERVFLQTEATTYKMECLS